MENKDFENKNPDIIEETQDVNIEENTTDTDITVIDTADKIQERLAGIKTSKELAEFISEGHSLSTETPNTQIANVQADTRGYLAMYARSQLKRIEKLTIYLNEMEDKMMCDLNSYDPDQFLKAMGILQKSLSSAIELVKAVSTDETYVNLFVNETNNYINGDMNVGVTNFNIPRESRDKIRSLIGKIIDSTQK